MVFFRAHELGLPHVVATHSCLSSISMSPLPGAPPPGHFPEALRTHVTLGVGTAETVLSRRVRFEARVLTQ